MADDDALYEPDFGRLGSLTSRLRTDSVLIAGQPDEDLVQSLRSAAGDIRQTTERRVLRETKDMPPGLYAAKIRSRWTLLVIPGVPPSGAAARSDSVAKIDDDWDPLVIAHDLIEGHWPTATPLSDERVWPGGTHVRVVGTNEFGRVVNHRRFGDSVQYTVEIQGVRNDVSSGQLEELPGRHERPARVDHVPASHGSPDRR